MTSFRIAKRGGALKSFVYKSGPLGEEYVECFTCAHCNRIVERPDREADMGFCERCFYPTCLECAKVYQCTPFEKKLEAMEQRARFLASVG